MNKTNNVIQRICKYCEEGNVEEINNLFAELEFKTHEYSPIKNSNYLKIIITESLRHKKLNIIKHIYDSLEQLRNSYSYSLDIFRTNLYIICENNDLATFKFFFEQLNNDISNSDFEKIALYSCKNGSLEVFQFLMESPTFERFISHRKYLNNILDCSSPKSKNIIKYCLNYEKTNNTIKQLLLLKKLYEHNQLELIEFLILEKNMLYSKKVKKEISLLSPCKEINLQAIFEKQKILQQAKIIEENTITTNNTKKLKI